MLIGWGRLGQKERKRGRNKGERKKKERKETGKER